MNAAIHPSFVFKKDHQAGGRAVKVSSGARTCIDLDGEEPCRRSRYNEKTKENRSPLTRKEQEKEGKKVNYG